VTAAADELADTVGAGAAGCGVLHPPPGDRRRLPCDEHATGKPAALLGAEETGVYLLAGPGGAGKTQLAVSFAHRLWQSRDIDLLV
jgi:hypothetical protein